MPKFMVTYAYDVPHYCDFVVSAKTPKAALAIARKALKEGRFSAVVGNADYQSPSGDRVFTAGDTDTEDRYPTMEQVTSPSGT